MLFHTNNKFRITYIITLIVRFVRFRIYSTLPRSRVCDAIAHNHGVHPSKSLLSFTTISLLRAMPRMIVRDASENDDNHLSQIISEPVIMHPDIHYLSCRNYYSDNFTNITQFTEQRQQHQSLPRLRTIPNARVIRERKR